MTQASVRTGRVTRVLDPEPVPDLAAYRAAGGFDGLADARAVEPGVIIDLVVDAGLRGRGGAGFPTGRKWRAVVENGSAAEPISVVVNAAEGEPGTFKDRAILRANPYRVLEGALIAAHAVGAHRVVVAIKHSFAREIDRVRTAIDELEAAGIDGLVPVSVVLGPSSYLFGEESALLEVVEGRQPFPRVTPPYRRGLDDGESGAANPASTVHLAGPGGTDESPSLVDNVETLANVPAVVVCGALWFRSVGTHASPGTVVCTVTGATRRHGVGEFAMGTPLAEILADLGGGALDGRRLVAVLPGTANAPVRADAFDAPVSYEGLAAIGSGLGSAGFLVIDDADDLVSVAHGVSRFLAVESCGQCEPCKLDGLEIAAHLDALRRSDGTALDVERARRRLDTVANGARCALGRQHQTAVGSLLALAGGSVDVHVTGRREGADEWTVAPLVEIVDGRAVLDDAQRGKQPDWSHDAVDSGKAPAARLENQPLRLRVTTGRR